MSRLWTFTLECAGGCGSRIEITAHTKIEDGTDACAELLGWTTVDKGKEQQVFCPWCIAQARRIVVATVGAGEQLLIVDNKIVARRKK